MKAESRSCRNMWAEKMCRSIKMLRTEAARFPDRKCCWTSRLSSCEGPGFEWQSSVHSDWPHSSLSPPSSTGLQGGSGCCSSWSGRHSPGPPGCVRPVWCCCCPPPSSSASTVRGSPRWPDTPVWHCPAAAPLGRGGGRSGWDAPHPLEERPERREGLDTIKSDWAVNWWWLRTVWHVWTMLDSVTIFFSLTSLYVVESLTWHRWNTGENTLHICVICLFHFLFTTKRINEASTQRKVAFMDKI